MTSPLLYDKINYIMKTLSYVYFILDSFSNAIKIGKANDIFDRLPTLQTGNPNPLTLLHYIECVSVDHAFYLENQYHQKFNHLHIQGEWFKYEKETFQKFIINESNISIKLKRQPLVRNTLFGKEVLLDPNKHPRCFFYSHLVAQIKGSYEESVKLTLPFRTMKWDTKGEQKLLPYSSEINRVFISSKKHQENLLQKNFEAKKKLEKNIIKNNTLEIFYHENIDQIS